MVGFFLVSSSTSKGDPKNFLEQDPSPKRAPAGVLQAKRQQEGPALLRLGEGQAPTDAAHDPPWWLRRVASLGSLLLSLLEILGETWGI